EKCRTGPRPVALGWFGDLDTSAVSISMPSKHIPNPQSRIPIRVVLTAFACLVLAGQSGLSAASSRRITVRTDDGVALAGTYFEASRHPAPGIVLLHMLTRTHDDWQAAGSRLADAGYAVLAID